MALSPKLMAMIEKAKKERFEELERVKRYEIEVKEKAVNSIKVILIHGLGKKLWKELESSEAEIKLDPETVSVDLVVSTDETTLTIHASPNETMEGKVKVTISIHENNELSFSPEARFISNDEVSEGSLKDTILLAFSHLES
jgi:hypothetical protein